MWARFGPEVGGAARNAALASVDGRLIKGGAGVLVTCGDFVDCLAGCALFKGKRLGDDRRGGGRLMGRGRLTGMRSACLAGSSATKPVSQPSRPPPTGSLRPGVVCTNLVCPTALNPMRLIRKLTKPQEVGGAWWETSSGSSVMATGSSVTAGIGMSAAGASMSDQRLSAISASRSSTLLAKLMNLARFRGSWLSYLEG